MVILMSVLFFVALALGGSAISITLRQRSEAEQKIASRLGGQTSFAPESPAAQRTLLKDLRLSSIDSLNALLGRVNAVGSLVRMMRQAGLTRRVGEIVLYIPLLALVCAFGGMVMTRNIAISAFLAMIGGMIPILVVSRMRKQRLAAFSEQLPDALDLMKAALQAGHSFVAALKVVAEEFPAPIAEEFDTVAEEVRLGLPLRDALQGLASRVEDANIPVMIVGILVVQESGGNMAEVLDNISHTVRERFKLLRDVDVMTAQGKLSGMLLTSLPFLVALALGALVPNYFDAMLASPTGHLMIAYSLGSIVMGHFTIQRIVKIRV